MGTHSHPNLLALGQLAAPSPKHNAYACGQVFLHARLGYTGIVVLPWRAEVYKYSMVRRKSSIDEFTAVNVGDANALTLDHNDRCCPSTTQHNGPPCVLTHTPLSPRDVQCFESD